VWVYWRMYVCVGVCMCRCVHAHACAVRCTLGPWQQSYAQPIIIHSPMSPCYFVNILLPPPGADSHQPCLQPLVADSHWSLAMGTGGRCPPGDAKLHELWQARRNAAASAAKAAAAAVAAASHRAEELGWQQVVASIKKGAKARAKKEKEAQKARAKKEKEAQKARAKKDKEAQKGKKGKKKCEKDKKDKKDETVWS
jgi:hypothetical protein